MNLHRILVRPELLLMYFHPLIVTKAERISPTYINWLLNMLAIYLSLQTYFSRASRDNILDIFVRKLWSKKPVHVPMAD